jgi:hypothetical protein
MLGNRIITPYDGIPVFESSKTGMPQKGLEKREIFF